MKFNEALDRTLRDCGISAKWLAGQAGLTPQAISEYRRGRKSLSTDNFERLLNELPLEARQYFFRQIGVPSHGDVWQQVYSMNAEELSQLIATIATIIPDLSKANEKSLQQV